MFPSVKPVRIDRRQPQHQCGETDRINRQNPAVGTLLSELPAGRFRRSGKVVNQATGLLRFESGEVFNELLDDPVGSAGACGHARGSPAGYHFGPELLPGFKVIRRHASAAADFSQLARVC